MIFSPFVLAFISTFLLTPFLAKKLEERGIVGVDLHKEEKPEIPEMGGLAVLLGFLLAASLAYIIYRDARILAGMVVTSLVGILGTIDGLRRLTATQKVISLSAVGLLLIPFSNPTLFGYDLGWLYLISIPILFMCACNFTNMLAGFNGLETGTGAMACLALAIIARMNYAFESFFLASAMAGSLLAFLYFNKYPARVFPGDVGTLVIGSVLFSAVILGNLEIPGAIIFLPYILDAALKYFSAGVMTRESQSPTVIKEGRLYIPEGGNLSLPRLLLRKKALKEEEVVHRIWALEGGTCLLAISVGVLLI
jgi:UDP-N-acetylglucosamine--dolichyl-phosphate N-acetylglucosaminephosphotransferase